MQRVLQGVVVIGPCIGASSGFGFRRAMGGGEGGIFLGLMF